MNDMRKLMEAIEVSQPIDGYIKGEIHDLALCITELENIAQLSRSEGSDATAGSVDSAADLIEQAIGALKRAESELGTKLESISEGPIVEPNDEWVSRLKGMKELIEDFEWRMDGMAYQAKIQGHTASAASLINIEADVNHIKKLFDAAVSDLEKEYDRPGGWPDGFDG